MKTALLVLVSVGVSVGATFFVVSNKKATEFAAERAALQSQWDSEKEKLERDLKRARGQSPRIETVTSTVEVPVDGRPTPDQLIARLALVQPTSDTDRAAQLREIIFLLESLKEQGQASVPAISTFLAKNQDVDYEPARTPNADGSDTGGGNGGGNQGGFRNRGGGGGGGGTGGFRNRGGGGSAQGAKGGQ